MGISRVSTVSTPVASTELLLPATISSTPQTMKSPEELALDLPTHLQYGLNTITKTYRYSGRSNVSEWSWEDLTHSARLFCSRPSKGFIPGSLQYILYPKKPDSPPFKPRYGIDITCRKVCVTDLATKPIFQIAPIPDEFFHILDEAMKWATDVCRADASKEGSVGEESQSADVVMMSDDQGEDEEDEPASSAPSLDGQDSDEEMSSDFPEDCCQDCGEQVSAPIFSSPMHRSLPLRCSYQLSQLDSRVRRMLQPFVPRAQLRRQAALLRVLLFRLLRQLHRGGPLLHVREVGLQGVCEEGFENVPRM